MMQLEIHKCVICCDELQKNDIIAKKFIELEKEGFARSDYDGNFQIFKSCCKLFQIPSMVIKKWDFKYDPLPFCDSCMGIIKRMTVLYDQMIALQRSIADMLFTTKSKILLTTCKQIDTESKNSISGSRFDAFRKYAVEDLTPVIPLAKEDINPGCRHLITNIESVSPTLMIAQQGSNANENDDDENNLKIKIENTLAYDEDYNDWNVPSFITGDEDLEEASASVNYCMTNEPEQEPDENLMQDPDYTPDPELSQTSSPKLKTKFTAKKPYKNNKNKLKSKSERKTRKRGPLQSKYNKRTKPITFSDGKIYVDDIEIKLDETQQKWICFKCNDTFTSKYNAANHVNAVHLGFGKNKLLSSISDDDKPLCKRIIKDEHGQLSCLGFKIKITSDNCYECLTCQALLKTKYNLVNHLKAKHLKIKRQKKKPIIVPNEKQANWIKMTKTTDGRYFFANVELIKMENGDYQCGACNRDGYKLQGSLIKHIKKHHTDKNNYTYKCQDCGEAFPYVYDLKMHQLIHISEKNFVCDICGLAVKRRSTLGEHKRSVHMKLTLYECDICLKKFYNKKDCRQHRNRHPTDKPCPPELMQTSLGMDRKKYNKSSSKSLVQKSTITEDEANPTAKFSDSNNETMLSINTIMSFSVQIPQEFS